MFLCCNSLSRFFSASFAIHIYLLIKKNIYSALGCVEKNDFINFISNKMIWYL